MELGKRELNQIDGRNTRTKRVVGSIPEQRLVIEPKRAAFSK